MTDENQAVGAPDPNGWEWAVVEILGHRRHAGRVREEERFGAKMLRIDIPTKGNPDAHGWTTHFYSAAAIFSFSLADEATCLRANRPYETPARLSVAGPDEPGDGDDTPDRFRWS